MFWIYMEERKLTKFFEIYYKTHNKLAINYLMHIRALKAHYWEYGSMRPFNDFEL